MGGALLLYPSVALQMRKRCMSSTGSVRTQLKVIILDACVASDSPYLRLMGWR